MLNVWVSMRMEREIVLFQNVLYTLIWFMGVCRKGREKKIIPVSQVKAMRQGLKRIRNKVT